MADRTQLRTAYRANEEAVVRERIAQARLDSSTLDETPATA